MTLLADEIAALADQLGVEVQDNLYCALKLALVAKRSVLIASKDPQLTHADTLLLVRTYWGVDVRSVRISPQDTAGEEVWNSINSGCAVLVIQHIHLLTPSAQNTLAELMRSRREELVVLGIASEQPQLTQLLRQAFWFKQPHTPTQQQSIPHFPQSIRAPHNLSSLHSHIPSITLVPEMKRYIYDIVIFVRTHRCVSTGIPTRATADMELLCRALCVLLERDYVIPTIVKLAARKILPLRLTLVDPALEPSLQWGSDPELVKEMMARVTEEIVVENCLEKVAPPL